MHVYDTSFLESEGIHAPKNGQWVWVSISLWAGAITGAVALFLFIGTHVAPAAGAAGGCGGG